jgi:NAD(P)-dependent dehydrogenase (short-subunit alcohol dehydrogenase family)
MRDFKGRTAFVTGGASGIGFAMAQAFTAVGMKVMLADIEQDALDAAVVSLSGTDAEVRGVVCDIADRTAVQGAARDTVAAFGKVHIVCNNAGVGAGGEMDSISPGDWEWVIGVNLMGVIYGIEVFLPHIKAHGEGGHIVNTASLVGIVPAPAGIGPYNATKAAVVSLSETLAAELAGTAIGVSVLLPGFVRTRTAESARNRAARYGKRTEVPAGATTSHAALVRAGIDPQEVARRVMTAIRDNDLYVFTHPEYRSSVEERFRNILAAFDKAAGVQE